MSERPLLIVPFRDPQAAKSRLSTALSQRERADLAWHMFRYVLAVAAEVLPTRDILVVTRSRRVKEDSRGRFGVLLEAAGGLNAALDLALEEVRKGPARRIGIVHADLPQLIPNDVRLLFETEDHELGIAPDELGIGTNALAFHSDRAVRPRFGSESFAAHETEARLHGLATWSMVTPGLSHDVDWPEDLARLQPKTNTPMAQTV